ncbi:hypothetical protein F4815DRAFT_449941 [Daldinia loculata]|nr:hypothetical protein F4815DRAFT_449941 [Daldinia loculata]
MTTAASAISPDGVWCCPTNLPWGLSPWCSTTLTKGSFESFIGCDLATQFSGITFGPGATQVFSLMHSMQQGGSETQFHTVTANTITVVVSATGVFLMGQTMAMANNTESVTMPTSSEVKPIEIPTAAAEGDDSSSSTSSSSVLIGVIVGCVVGVGILAGLAYFILLRRQRRHKTQQDGRSTSINGANHDHNLCDDYRKAELDASVEATRSELEGTLGISHGAGIYIQKPELEGTRGMSNAGGAVYVKNKAELEARPNQVSELEAIPCSVSRKKEAPPSPTIKIQDLGRSHRDQKPSRHELS